MRPDLQRWPGKVAVVAVLALGLGGCALTREPIDTPSAPASLPSVGKEGVSRPDSIWDSMLGLRPAFSASCRCCSARSARMARMR